MKWTVLGLTVVFLALAGLFKKRQDRAKMGGSIAWSKSFWLQYTLLSWFVLPIVLQFAPVSTPFKAVLLTLTASMWIRGVAELAMLYKYKNWKPLYGLAHDLFTIAGMLLAIAAGASGISFAEGVYLASLLASLFLESYYAYFFLKHVGEKTRGDKAVWFASRDNPIFKNVLRVTAGGNTLVYLALVWFAFKALD